MKTENSTRAPYDGNTATLPTERHENARNYGGEKETVNTMSAVVHRADGEFRTPVDVRWYMGRSRNASVVYCSIWIHWGDVHLTGRGTAGGCGYHKESAALDEAIHSAGITLDKHIGGCGESSMLHAVEAIISALGITDPFTITR